MYIGNTSVSPTLRPVGTSGWKQVIATYTHPETATATTANVILYHAERGTSYFDSIQLVESAGPTRYNLINNADFRFGTSGWTKGSTCTSSDTVTTVSASAAPQLNTSAYKISGSATASKSVYQTVNVSGAAGDVYSLAGWGKGDSVPLSDDTRTFGLMLEFVNTDGTTTKKTISFNPDCDSSNNWQYVADRAIADKAYSSIKVYLLYGNNMNTVYYDGLQLFKEEFGQSYTYEDDKLVSTIDLQKQKTSYEYTNNNLTKILLNDNQVIASYQYDTYNNVTQAVSETGVTTNFTYDDYGNNTKVTIVNGGKEITSTATYASGGNQLSTVTDALGNTTTYGYNSQTGVLDWLQAPGETSSTRTNYSHDSVFRTTGVSKGATTAAYTYENDLLDTITSASGTVYDFAYGAFDLVQSVKAGSRSLIAHQYSTDGNYYLTQSTYGNGDTVSYTYDDLGRNTVKTYEDGDKVTYAYDANGNLGLVTDSESGRTTQYAYDLQDRLSAYTETGTGYSNSVTWIYDVRNNLTSQTQLLNGSTYTTNFTYDDDNQLTGTTQGSFTGTYAYDGFGRMNSVIGKKDGSTVVTSEISYKAPTSATTSTQISEWKNITSGGTTAYTYTYDSRGNIITISDGTHTTSYVYDHLDQLVRENNQAAGKSWVYTYDNGGNILSKTEHDYATGDLGPALDTVSYAYGDATWKDLLTTYDGQTLTYDGVGNLTGDGAWNYTWQHGRQLAMMAQPDSTRTAEDSEGNSFSYTYPGAQVRYTYDAEGKRISKTYLTPPMSVSPEMAQAGVPLSTQQELEYHYAGDQLVAITDFGSNFLRFTYDLLGPATVTYGNSTYYYLRNAQGDVIGIANSSGTQVVSYRYDAWGNILSIDGTMASTLGQDNPFRYRGYVYDNETGLYYLTSRYYDPGMGRFINADGYISTGQDLLGNNVFAYCCNNPVSRMDDGGEFWHLIVGAVVGVAVKYASDVVSNIASGKKGLDILKPTSSVLAYAGAAASGALAASGVGAVGQVVANATISAATSVESQLRSSNSVSVKQVIVDTTIGAATGLISGAGASSVKAGAGGAKQMVNLGTSTIKRTVSAMSNGGLAAYAKESKKAAVHYIKSTVKVTNNMFNLKNFVLNLGNVAYSGISAVINWE
ncbi:MAG: RHS repeat protein [Ruminococcaceae bacterium]|nr:RHS repeat protein [Oscillospiraceae bacterium]